MSLTNDFKARFPEFSDAVVDQHLPVLESVWPCYFNKPYTGCNQEAVLNLVAHLLTLEVQASKAPSRTVSSKSVGSVSTSYATAAPSGGGLSEAYGSTKYGQRFLILIQSGAGACAV